MTVWTEWTEWIQVLTFIMGGCCSNVFSLEILIQNQPKSGQFITFAQFLLVSIEGLVHHIDVDKLLHGRIQFKPRQIPLSSWLVLVLLYWTVSMLNNFSLGFNISMPFHIIFRSAGLVVSLILSMIVLKKRYSVSQIISVLIVTIGILITTFASSSNRLKKQSLNDSLDSYTSWLIGIGILIIGLILSSLMGLYQEYIYKRYGRASWREGLFYIHFLSLPAFLLVYGDIQRDFTIYTRSDIVYPFKDLGYTFLKSFSIPILWMYLLLNICTQYFCISGVQRLSCISSSVTLNLILSVRKFTSLIISIILFKNEFNVNHWIGSILVFIGTVLYSSSSSASTIAKSNTATTVTKTTKFVEKKRSIKTKSKSKKNKIE